RVALKFVSLDTQFSSYELRALELMERVRHPHLLSTLGDWQKGGYLIIAMPLAERSLLDRQREATKAEGRAGIPAAELLKYMGEAAEGTDYLNWELNIQHGDIKPTNLLLVGGRVQLADFGVARLLTHADAAHGVGGTPA